MFPPFPRTPPPLPEPNPLHQPRHSARYSPIQSGFSFHHIMIYIITIPRILSIYPPPLYPHHLSILSPLSYLPHPSHLIHAIYSIYPLPLSISLSSFPYLSSSSSPPLLPFVANVYMYILIYYYILFILSISHNINTSVYR